MKRICVLGDTHVRHWHEIPAAIKAEFKQSDYIVHLGDFDSLELLEEFSKLNNFCGVTGNHDRSLRAILPEKDIIEIEGKRLGLVHGHGCFWPIGMLRKGLMRRFRGETLDAVLYGHTHRMNNVVDGGTLFFNPGSAAGRFPATQLSYGILTLNGTVSSELFTIENPLPVGEVTGCTGVTRY